MNKYNYIAKTSELLIIPKADEPVKGAKRWELTYGIFIRQKRVPKEEIGYVRFDAPPVLGAVTMYLFIQEEYRNRGFGTEVLKEMLQWCFYQRKVYEVEIRIPIEDDAFLHMIQKTPFVYRGREQGFEYYSAVKQKTAWLGLYLLIGILVGGMLGIVLGNVYIGFVIGVIAGVLAGGILDAGELKRREAILGRKDRKITFGREMK